MSGRSTLRPPVAGRPHDGGLAPPPESGGTPRPLVLRRAVAVAVAAAIPAYLAARGGGYDLVVRQEFGLVLWTLIAAGLAFGVLPRSRIRWPVIAVLAAAGAFAVLNALSLTWTASSERTFAEVARVLIYAGIVVLALLGLNRFTWRAAAVGLGAAAVGICALALASRLAPGSFNDPIASFFLTDRLSYPLNYWNALGCWGAMTLAMGLAWSANARRLPMRCAGLASVPVAALTVYLTYSRGGVAATVAAVVAVVALSRNRWTAVAHGAAAGAASGLVIAVARGEPAIANATGSAGAAAVVLALLGACAACAVVALVTASASIDDVRLPKRVATPALVGGLVVTALAVGIGAHGAISRQWHEFENQRTVASAADPAARLGNLGGSRHAVWTAAVDAFDAHPAGGIGPGTFEFWWAQHGKGSEFLRDAHSLYLEQMAELGLPGLLLLLAFLGVPLGLALRARARLRRSSDIAASVAVCSAAIAFCVQAGVDWMWEVTAVGALGIGAMAVGASALSDRRQPGARRWLGWRGALVLAATVAAIVEVPGLVSGAREAQSEAALAAGNAAEARHLASQAITAEPWQATAYEQRAAAELRQGSKHAARADLKHAIANEPTDWRQHLQLSQVELELGHGPAARLQYEQFRRLNRTSRPFTSFDEFRRDVSSTCLVLGPGGCGAGQPTLVPRSQCLAVPAALTASLSGAGAEALTGLTAVRATNGAGYFVAARTPGTGIALWAVDNNAWQLGTVGVVVPLNAAARSASARGAGTSSAAFGVSVSDPDALAARSCLARR